MIIISLKSTGQCIGEDHRDIEDLKILDNKAYFGDEIVCNNVAICDIEDYPEQSITQINGFGELESKTVDDLIKYTIETKWVAIRAKRYKLICNTDWTQLPDSPKKGLKAWLDYRQALRDITEQPDPFNIVWPKRPGE